MIEVTLEEGDRLDWALKAFKKKMVRSGILKDLRRKRFYEKPSVARARKAAEAKRRSKPRAARTPR
jgi:small subunit ribosomal protein S21